MGIETDSLLMKLSPTGGLFSGAQGGGLERQKLKLMREQFENQKVQQERAAEMARLEEGGRMARERMQGERQAAHDAAAAAQAEAQAKAVADAESKKKKLEANQKFAELNASGDLEAARAMVPYMTALGMGVDLEGEEAGLPRYRISMDPEADAQAETTQRYDAAAAGDEMGAAGIGYDTVNDSGDMNEPAGISSTADAFGAAQQASRFSESTGQPYMQPDAPDLTGGVPKNVLDMGAIQSQALARLDPALKGMVAARPEEHQESARQITQGVRGLGLPAVKALELANTLQGRPDALATAKIDAEAQAGRFAQTQDKAGSNEAVSRYKLGYDTIASKVGETYGAKDLLNGREQTKRARDILTNDKDSDDDLVLALISRRMGERGATTEGDIKRVTGQSAQSWLNQLGSYFEKGMTGGLPLAQKNALLGVLKAMEESDKQRYLTVYGKLEDEANHPDTDPDVAKGIRAYGRAMVPQDIRDEYLSKSGKGQSSGRPVPDDSGDGMVTGEIVIPDSARIAKVHNNPGNLMFADQAGATKGEPKEGGGFWAKFETPEAGVQALRAQIEHDEDLTLEAFITKYAPPSDKNDTKKYIADVLAELKAEPGDKVYDVDAYDLLRFIARKESGTELPGQYDGDKKQTDAVEPPAADATERIKQLLKKAGK